MRTFAAEWKALSLVAALVAFATTSLATLVSPPLNEAVLCAVAQAQGNVLQGHRPARVAYHAR
jgi:hypothetical protein